MITRVAFRDNSSKYYINGRASNFTEVTRTLKGKGVDLDNNRFLILQVPYWGAAFILFEVVYLLSVLRLCLSLFIRGKLSRFH